MAADVLGNLYSWSITAASNQPQGSTTISTNLDDNLREIQKVVRYTQSRDTIASAATCDIGAKDAMSLDVTGTTTITSLGTVSAGIRKWLTFSGALTLTYNATSLKIPGNASITTAAGDRCCVESLGSGNWNVLSYQKADGTPVVVSAAHLSDLQGSVAANSIAHGAYAQTWTWGTMAVGADKGLVLSGVGSTNGTLVTIKAPQNGTVTALDVQDTTSSVSMLKVSFGSVSIAGAGGTIGGALSFVGGANSGGNAGNVQITGGACTYVVGSPTGGSVTVQGGDSSAGYGGNVLLYAGIGSSTNLHGTVTIQGGARTVALRIGAKVPTISSGGGAGASIRGCDNFFEVTFGTGSPTNVVVGFGVSKGATPMCLLTTDQSGQTLTYACTTTQVTITGAAAFSNGSKVTCMLVDMS